ncbi:MAG: GNAT family N-acetyltransferase [Saprospiraceae bacterium]
MKSIQIRLGSIPEVVALSQAIPEFKDPHTAEVYEERISSVPHLILVAEIEGEPAGFKVGYERDRIFYSWMGAVLPAYRRLGIAQKLANQQEKWAKPQAYTTIRCKTRNHHKGMFIFALKNGFDVIEVQVKDSIGENRILLQKTIV